MTQAGVLTVTILVLSAAPGCGGTSAPASPVSPGVGTAFDAAVTRYRAALQTICSTGVTAEIRQRYDETVRAAEAARYGGGRQANFWGPRHPEAAYNDCFQSPSFQ
jgi:hypothetical protein